MVIYSLIDERNLRGYAFEFVAQSILRRSKKNNFIFQLSRFDSIDEILIKYRLIVPSKYLELMDYLRKEWNRCDLIEFDLISISDREINNLIFYDVKTKFHLVKRDYFEICKSAESFFKTVQSKFLIPVNFVSMILFDRWRFSFQIIPYNSVFKRVYSRFNK